MAARDPELRRISASIAASTRAAHTPDRTSLTEAARAAWRRRLEDEVDPDRALSPDERARRVASLRRAYASRAALVRWKADRERRAAAEVAQAEAELDAILAGGVA